MIVVVHQHIGKNRHIKTVRNFTHKTNEIVPVFVIQKEIPLFVPPRKNMI
jgi:hypothetical protein